MSKARNLITALTISSRNYSYLPILTDHT